MRAIRALLVLAAIHVAGIYTAKKLIELLTQPER